jgi:hypothetical protein
LIYQNPEVSVGTQVVCHQQLEHQQQQVHREGDEHGFVLKNMSTVELLWVQLTRISITNILASVANPDDPYVFWASWIWIRIH